MLQVKAFTFNPFQENTYLLINERKDCWIIDPGMYGVQEEKKLVDFMTLNGLQPKQIINTHTHIDHIFGVDALKQKYNIPFGAHRSEAPVLQSARGSAMMFGFNFGAAPVVDFFIEEGKNLLLGNDELQVLLCPGHSPGSIVFYNKGAGWAIAGDVLFNGSIGRSDLPGGNHEVLVNSIRTQLYALPKETEIYPGHGPATTIGAEMRHNPFVKA
ncbi:MAG: MBL fold metallo-hydrolase [Edaphocola sp.]